MTPGGNTGSYDEMWGLSLSGCVNECIAHGECVAIEHSRLPPRYTLCELHKDLPSHTVPVVASECLLRPTRPTSHAAHSHAPALSHSPPPPLPPPPVHASAGGRFFYEYKCLARGCQADGGFRDDFSGTALDRSAWNVRVDRVDARSGACGAHNNEDQCYVDSPSHIYVRDGKLHLVARRAPNGRISSARIQTRDKVEIAYGRWEARLKVPGVLGSLPAFWTIGFDFPSIGWPASGEIDVMENFNHGGKSAADRTRFTSTVHSLDFHGGGRSPPLDLSKYHTVRLDWSPDALRFYVDEYPTWSYTRKPGSSNSDWPFAKPHFAILNLAVGGNGVGGYMPLPSAFPLTFVIDYVSIQPLQRVAPPACTGRKEANVQCDGNDIRNAGSVSDGDTCCRRCQATSGCRVWTWNRAYDQVCWLKTSCARKSPNPRTDSGFVTAPRSQLSPTKLGARG